jgi:pantoate--beta-alanine ligase
VELIRTAEGLEALAKERRAAGDTVGLVPTMGALHGGHQSLMRRARSERSFVIASIFVNPRQFSDDEDFQRYPRDEARDLATCEAIGVDVVWAPPEEQVFPPGSDPPSPDPGEGAARFEGGARPGHFAGVLSVVHRYFEVVGSSAAYFGEKDAQQLFLIRQMVLRLGLPIEVVACPTIREPDGLALSSRNTLLGPQEREQAGCLFLALSEAAAAARSGEQEVAVIVALMAREIGATPLASLDYAAVVDDGSFEPLERIEPGRPARALVAARFPSARLIDNLALMSPRDGGPGCC